MVTKRILLVTEHNAFREALAARLNQEEDLEVIWQAGSLADTRGVHLNGIDVALVDPLLPEETRVVLLGLRFGRVYSFSVFLYMGGPPVQPFGFVYC